MNTNNFEKYKEKINTIIMQKGLCSMMNHTKWKELKNGVNELPFLPPFIIKSIDEEETSYHQFDKDVYYTGDWGLRRFGYPGNY